VEGDSPVTVPSVHDALSARPPFGARDGLLKWASVGVVAALLVGAYFAPWWTFILYAPQYPAGLRLLVSLTGVSGDVHEIDTLNHYIGMSSLAHAAPIERALAAYGVMLVVALSLVLWLGPGRGRHRLALLPVFAFPVGFMADSYYWLHRFGHHLNPRAPLKLAPFTPEMFGNGVIGQFMTFARPEIGFWMAVAAAITLLLAIGARERIGDREGAHRSGAHRRPTPSHAPAEGRTG
jgi:hypothetical protein